MMKYCEACGQEIMDETVICPHCGCKVKRPTAPSVSQQAKMAQIFGIIGLFLFRLPLGIASIIFANKSKEETGGQMCSQARTGFICGIIALCLWVVQLFLIMPLLSSYYRMLQELTSMIGNY